MKFRTPVAALAVASLALAACSTDETADESTSVDAPDPTADADVDVDGGVDENGDDVDENDDDSTDPPAGETSGDDDAASDVPEGVAASIGSTEITVDTVEGIYDELAASPSLAAQIEDDETGMTSSTVRAQVLSQLVVQEVITDAAADDFGIEVTEADLDASLAEVESETEAQGGLDAALEVSGLSRATFLELELPLIALLDQLEGEFGALQPAPDAAPGEVPEGQAELQEWGSAAFAAADVTVAADYGVWDPLSGQVQPAGLPDMSPPVTD